MRKPPRVPATARTVRARSAPLSMARRIVRSQQRTRAAASAKADGDEAASSPLKPKVR
jgi:hypothetical protein